LYFEDESWQRVKCDGDDDGMRDDDDDDKSNALKKVFQAKIDRSRDSASLFILMFTSSSSSDSSETDFMTDCFDRT